MPHFHLGGGDPPDRIVQIHLAPFSITQFSRSHEQERGQLERSGGVCVAMVAVDRAH